MEHLTPRTMIVKKAPILKKNFKFIRRKIKEGKERGRKRRRKEKGNWDKLSFEKETG